MEKTINYKGIKIKNDLYPIIKYIEDVNRYKDELTTLNSSWDILSLLGQLGDINIDIGKTKENFLNLTSTLLNHLAIQQIKKVTQEIEFKSQVTIDILVRNLFERSADIGFLSTDEDIRAYLEQFISKYDENSLNLRENIRQRFKEYIAKYSVYFDIVLFDTRGKIVARVDEDLSIEKVDTSFIQKVLYTNEDYLQTFQFHDFLPKLNKSLVYSYKITNSSKSENLGVLSLCFKFKDEMRVIFNNLINHRNKECLTIIDENGYVLASSHKEHINLGEKLPVILKDGYEIVSFKGRDYLAKSSKTTGYQEFFGPKWYGHIMIPLEYAFLSEEDNDLIIDEKVINSMIQNEQHFSKELRDVFENSKAIQENLKRVIWNGNIIQSKIDSANKSFSKALLNEIGLTGNKASSSLENLNHTIISSILKDSEFLSQLAIDIMDRNLYERANDCRWWALNSGFINALESGNFDEKIANNLKYINSLYTIYTNLLLFDKNGIVIAVSNDKYKHLVGKSLSYDWLEKGLALVDTSKYCVSNFEKTSLYDDMQTYIYCSSIFSAKDSKKVVGAIATIFDSKEQFYSILDEILPKDSLGNKQDGVFAFFTDNKKKSSQQQI